MTQNASPQVLVLCGGLSPERDVSLRSGRRVAEALRRTGLSVETADLDANIMIRLAHNPPQCAIPLLHGAAGEDGSLADALTTLDLPFVGSSADANRLSFDKSVAKAVARRWGVPTPDSVALPHAMFRELGAQSLLHRVVERLGLPLIVKPTKGGSALGVASVHATQELPSAMVGAFAYGDVALVERLVSGTEVSVGIIEIDGEPTVLPPVEILPDSGLYDYNARYTAGMTEFFTPARLSDAQAQTATELALTMHKRLGLRDYSRISLIMDNDQTWFIQANVVPGMTETSLMPQALESAGISLGDAFAGLVQAAVNR